MAKSYTLHDGDSKCDYDNNRLVMIGNEASAQQLIPNIHGIVRHIYHYVRMKTWVTATFAKDLYEATAQQPGEPKYTEAERELFKSSSIDYLQHRKELEARFHHKPGADLLGSKENAILRDRIIEVMLRRIGGSHEFLQKILPDYAPGCKRWTPAPRYLESLFDEKVEFILDTISEVDESEIWTQDCVQHPANGIVLATGFDHGLTTKFPVVGIDETDLRERWSEEEDIGLFGSHGFRCTEQLYSSPG